MTNAKIIDAARQVERWYSGYYSDVIDSRIASAFGRFVELLEEADTDERSE